ncbi:MAG: hypothetical protein J3Q66DRAFT_420116 [Benniella sp.]|nr:MAG: hypothetical protein J3Q66DRAFT_420116 [Benniella sp.]
MAQVANLISFHDLSPKAHFPWASPTVYEALGYEPEELVGMGTYGLVYPEDHLQGKEFHKGSITNDLVASQIVFRYKAKNGRPATWSVSAMTLPSTTQLYWTKLLKDPSGFKRLLQLLWDFSLRYLQRRSHSSAMTRRVGSKKEFERMKHHHQAFAANIWDHQTMEPEARVCFILNRFSRNFIVMYASSACGKVFQVNLEDIIGKPILLRIRADDLAPFKTAVSEVPIFKEVVVQFYDEDDEDDVDTMTKDVPIRVWIRTNMSQQTPTSCDMVYIIDSYPALTLETPTGVGRWIAKY